MNRRGGIFAPVILIIMLVLLIYIWSVLIPTAYAPEADRTLSTISGQANADGTEFFIRMIPWGVPVVLIIGFIWLMVKE